MMNEFTRKINEHKEAPPGGEHRDIIDAFVSRMNGENGSEGTTFTRKVSVSYLRIRRDFILLLDYVVKVKTCRHSIFLLRQKMLLPANDATM